MALAKGKTAGNSGKSKELLNKLGGDAPPDRAPRTLSLNTHNYKRLEKICDERKIKVSHLIDQLISDFFADLDSGG